MAPQVQLDAAGNQVQVMAPSVGYQQVVTTTYHQTVTTHTFTRIDPGEYEGPTDESGQRCGIGSCKWADGSTYEGSWQSGVRWG